MRTAFSRNSNIMNRLTPVGVKTKICTGGGIGYTRQIKDLMPQGVWVRVPPGVQYFGPACTKAGGTLWQGDRGEFDSRLVHKYGA